MAVKIRLTRRGRKKLALYDLIVADARSPRDGRFIEKLGMYNPNTDPATIDFNEDRAFHWLMVGAQPTDTVRRILSYKGILYKKHLQVGVNKGAITQEEADKKLEAWLNEKSEAVQTKRDRLAKEATDAKTAKKAAEKKVSDARAETIAKKNIVEEEVQTEAPAEEAKAEETPAAEVKAEEAPAEEAKAEEAPAEEVKAEEAPAEEVKAEEAPAEEAKAEEAPAAEVKAEEAPAEEAKAEEAPAAEAKEEPKADASEEEEKKAE